MGQKKDNLRLTAKDKQANAKAIHKALRDVPLKNVRHLYDNKHPRALLMVLEPCATTEHKHRAVKEAKVRGYSPVYLMLDQGTSLELAMVA